jgi:dolichyl-phosphate beta-glucosyltransferase
MGKRGLSIVIPAFNEERRLPPTIREVMDWAAATAVFDVELIIVDDGSADATCDIVREMARTEPRLRLVEEPHVGAMNAILSGFRHARHELVGNMDADCAVHPREFERLLPHVGEKGCAIGSRILRGDLPPVEGKSAARSLISWIMSTLFVVLFPMGVRDPQIGFKLYDRKAVLGVVPKMRLKHDGLKHAEIIVRAHGLGMTVTELPVPYIHDDDSRCVPKAPLKALKTTMRAGLAVFEIWIQCSLDYRRGLLPRCPTRGSILFVPFA